MNQFSQSIIESILYYVYILKNRNTNEVFYVGKGKGNRVFQHVECALETELSSDKLKMIREIGTDNIQHFILRHGLTEAQALEIESACIDLLGLEDLTNEVAGHNAMERGMKSIDEIVQHYDAKVINIEEPAIIININKLYKRFMTPEALYEATRTCWKLSIKRENAKYVLASYRGLVREVFKVEKWFPVDNRWAFDGTIASPEIRDKYLNQSLENYIQKGNQNPIKYTF
ncbi:MAG: excinuclease ABC [Paludibacter sp.]